MSAISEKLEVLLHDAVECTDVLVSSVDTEFQIPILEWISDDKLSFHHVILEFFQNHLLQNTPCILSETATSNWKSRRKWVTDDLKPDFEYLKTHFGTVFTSFCCHLNGMHFSFDEITNIRNIFDLNANL